MLVRRGDLSKRGQLTLRRVMASGRILDVWSHDSAATLGAIAGGAGRTIAIWLENLRPSAAARAQAEARRGHGFGKPFTLRTDARGDTAVVTKGGELVVGLLRKTVQPEVFTGSPTVLHAPDVFVEIEPANPAFGPLLALDAAGDDALAWRTAGALQILR